MPKPFHLAWFTNFTAGNGDGTFSHGGSPWDGRFFVDMAQALERACFDYVIYEDKLLVPEAYRGSTETTLKYAQQVPKHEPVPLPAMVAAATSRLGVVATMSPLAWPPFMLARASKHDRPHCRRPFRLEYRDQRRGSRSPEIRDGCAATARHALRHGRRIHGPRQSTVRLMGTGRGGQRSRTRRLRRSHEGASHPFQRRVLQVSRSAQHRAVAAGTTDLCAGRRLARRPRFCS